MNPVTIEKTIEIEAPPAKVWSRIGTAAGLSEWWDADISMDEHEGGHFAEVGQWNGQSYRQTGEVLVYDPPRQLVIKLHQVGGGIEWPIHTEIDIRLEERIGPEGEAHTCVSITHRAFRDVTDAIASATLTSTDPNVEGAFGPTMLLPQNAGASDHTSVAQVVQDTQTASVTLQGLYQWKHQQEARWERSSMLLIALLKPTQRIQP